MKRGIYLVANLKSQNLCANLIHSIRETGCTLPIRLIHFGGKKITSSFILKNVEFLEPDNFPNEAKELIGSLQTILNCPTGFLYRFLPWFSDWDEFIYSDNDIVALNNWESLFDFITGYDIVHADKEYTTAGKFNYNYPEKIKEIFGPFALESAFTAGHFAAKRNLRLISDIRKAIEWFLEHPGIPKQHDQALLHIAALIGNWKLLNLCKTPHNWLSSWAGDYRHPLDLIQQIQNSKLPNNISHIHYSGSTPYGNSPIEELLFSNLPNNQRLKKLASISFLKLSGMLFLKEKKKRAIQRIQNLF